MPRPALAKNAIGERHKRPTTIHNPAFPPLDAHYTCIYIIIIIIIIIIITIIIIIIIIITIIIIIILEWPFGNAEWMPRPALAKNAIG